MDKINEDYFIVKKNNKYERIDRDLTLLISITLATMDRNQDVFFEQILSRPIGLKIKYLDDFEKINGKLETLDLDFMVESSFGLVFHKRHREFFIKNMKGDDIFLQAVVIKGEREKGEDLFSEDYFILLAPDRSVSWVDIEKCVYFDAGKKDYVLGTKNVQDIFALDTIVLKSEVNDIPLKNRQIFQILNYENEGLFGILLHKDIVKYVQEHDKDKQVAFYTIEEVVKAGSVLSAEQEYIE